MKSITITEQLTKFNKILNDLVNIQVEVKDEDKVLLLLCALPISFKDIMIYGKEYTITLDEDQSTLRTKELKKLKDLEFDDSGEGLSVSRGRRGSRRNCGNSKGGNNSKHKCFKCYKYGLL